MVSTQELYDHFKKCNGVTTDTRKLGLNCLFFALKGDNFNGNKFAQQALEGGAKYAVIDEEEFAGIPNTILVKDVLKSLQDLANFHRKQFDIPFLAITGSNGKTTTKELIRDVLKKKYNVLATKGNLNNHIGVPLTLLELNSDHNFAIIEMGANHQGEIEELCKIANPDYGMITNIGKAHIEGFGGVEGIKKGKSELYRYIKNKRGLIFINSRDQVLIDLLGQYDRTFTYGDKGSDVVLNLHSANPAVVFDWINHGEHNSIQLQVYGAYNFSNAAAAVAIGHYFKVGKTAIIAALEAYESQNNRSQLIRAGSKLIYLDAYNANPSSMTLALQSFFEVDSNSKAVILGDMLELGNDAVNEHRRIIDLLENEFNGRVLLVGKIFKEAASGSKYPVFLSAGDLVDYIRNKGIDAADVLIKGSRMIGLEKVVEHLN